MTAQPPAPHPEPQPGQGGTEADAATEIEGRQKVIAARLWVAKNRPYFTFALFSCPLAFTQEVEGFAIDAGWRIHINPLTAAALSVGEVAGSLIHELNHALRGHHGRGRRAGVPDEHHFIWNLAGDCEINDDLRADGLSRRPGVVYAEDYDLPPAKLAETYYRLLLKNAETIELPAICCDSATRGPDGPHPHPGLSAARDNTCAAPPPRRSSTTGTSTAGGPPP